MNPLVIAGVVALIGFLATLGGKAGADGGVVINGNGGAGNGNGNGNGGDLPAPAPVLTATFVSSDIDVVVN